MAEELHHRVVVVHGLCGSAHLVLEVERLDGRADHVAVVDIPLVVLFGIEVEVAEVDGIDGAQGHVLVLRVDGLSALVERHLARTVRAVANVVAHVVACLSVGHGVDDGDAFLLADAWHVLVADLCHYLAALEHFLDLRAVVGEGPDADLGHHAGGGFKIRCGEVLQHACLHVVLQCHAACAVADELPERYEVGSFALWNGHDLLVLVVLHRLEPFHDVLVGVLAA